MFDLIKTLHDEFQERINTLDHLIDRQDVLWTELPDKISVILGMRRVGKTYLMFHKIKQLIALNIPISSILYIA